MKTSNSTILAMRQQIRNIQHAMNEYIAAESRQSKSSRLNDYESAQVSKQSSLCDIKGALDEMLGRMSDMMVSDGMIEAGSSIFTIKETTMDHLNRIGRENKERAMKA